MGGLEEGRQLLTQYRYIHETNRLEPSTAFFEDRPAFFVSVPLRVLSVVNFVRIEEDKEGYIKSTTNLTLLNALLCFFGSMDERSLAIVTLVVQIACSAVAFGVRYGLASFVYDIA